MGTTFTTDSGRPRMAAVLVRTVNIPWVLVQMVRRPSSDQSAVAAQGSI